MILVTITKTNNLIKEIIVKGHANSNKYNKDLVCAGVSSIVSGTINAISEIKGNVKYGVENGYAIIQFEDDNTSQIIANTMIIQLKTIEESNQKFIKIIYS